MKWAGILLLTLLTCWAHAQVNYDVKEETSISGYYLHYRFVKGGLEVVRPNDSADYFNKKIKRKTVTIPETVDVIIDSLYMTDTTYTVVSIGDSAFLFAPLSKIQLPTSITQIGAMAFYECTELTSMKLTGYNIDTIGDDAFASCVFLKTVTLPQGLRYLGKRAFSHCSSLTSISFFPALHKIEQNTFSYSGLIKVEFSDSLTQIDESAFAYTQIDTLTLTNQISIVGINAFAYCMNLEHINWSSELISIGAGAFNYCRKLDSLILPQKLTVVHTMAFNNCQNVKKLFIPRNLTSINTSAFRNLHSLKEIEVDTNNTQLTSLNGHNAVFHKGTGKLLLGCKNTDIPSTTYEIGRNAFFGCIGLKNITLHDSISMIEDSAFYGCKELTSIKLPAKIKRLYPATFMECQNLSTLIINKNLKRIDESAFYNCQNLVNISFGDSLTRIGEYAFYQCYSQTTYTYDEKTGMAIPKTYSLKFPESMKKIDSYAFQNCMFLSNVTFDFELTHLDDGCFKGCKELQDLVFPDSLWYIGHNVFADCPKIDTVYMTRDVPPQTYGPGLDTSTLFIIPCGTFYDYAMVWGLYKYKHFEEVYPIDFTFTLTTPDSSKGHAEMIMQGLHDVGCDSSVILLAVAEPGWMFDQWTNGSRKNPDTIWIDHETTYAVFFTYDVTPDICMVTVEDEKNTIVWFEDYEVNYYFIYRYDKTLNQRTRMDTISPIGLGKMHKWSDAEADITKETYYYTVSAVDTNGAESPTKGPYTPTRLSYKRFSANVVKLTWTAYDEMFSRSYRILRGTNLDSLKTLTILSYDNGRTFTDVEAPPGFVAYRVETELYHTCVDGSVPCTSTNTITDGSFSDIPETDATNPLIRVLNGQIRVDGTTFQSVKVYDMMGRQVAATSPTPSLHPGVYMVMVDGTMLGKAVVM